MDRRDGRDISWWQTKKKGASKRGRGTSKQAVVGAVERSGKVVAEPAKSNKLSF